MTTPRRLAIAALIASIVQPSVAHATVGLFFGVGAVSYTATGLLGRAAIKTKGKPQQVLAAGAVAVALIDPDPAVYYRGSFVQHYDPTLLRVLETGWLGSWGEDPSLPAPPADMAAWPDAGAPVFIQAPNAALSATVVNDALNGTLTTTFDWGPSGHADDVGPFNFFATTFEVLRTSSLTLLGSAPDGQPPAGANLYASAGPALGTAQEGGILCTPPGETDIGRCGEEETQYYEVSAVPEPTTVVLAATGLAALLALSRWPPRSRAGGPRGG